MKFLLVENIPRSAADLIEEYGHEAVRFDAVCNAGDDDDTVFVAAQRVCATMFSFFGIFRIVYDEKAGF